MIEFIGKAKKLSLDEFARAAHLREADISPVGNYLFFTSYITRWTADERSGNFYILIELLDIYYTETPDNKKYRFMEYNYVEDTAKLVNGIIENQMDREPFDYIPIVDAISFIEEEVLKIINKEK